MSPSAVDPPRSALVVAAHADDEALGCGGTIAKLARQGWAVDVVVVTDGVITARGGSQDNREAAAEAGKLLGVEPPRYLGFPDQRLDQVALADLSNALLEQVGAPSLVLTHSSQDLNADHRLVAEAVRIVFRPAGPPVSVLEFEVPGAAFWNGQTFEANYFVDISADLDTKLAAFSTYTREQRAAPHPRSLEGISRLARYRGTQVMVDAAEAFRVVRGFEGQLP